jgi:hypothetical protein
MDPYLVQHVILCDTELCLELNISIEIKYIRIYKFPLGYIDVELKVLEVLKDVLKLF